MLNQPVQTERIKVSDIVEYPWRLGERCNLLLEHGLHPYSNTAEEILEFLNKSAEDKEMLSFCMASSRCSAFHECFRRGETPFTSRDPVALLEYNGHYWAHEGKHRVCLAKRTGVEYIDARIIHLPQDTMQLLEPICAPTPLSFSFSASFGTIPQGQVAALWLKSKDINALPYSFLPIVLNGENAKERREEIVPGVIVEIKREKEGLVRKKEIITAHIEIKTESPSFRIWLCTRPAAGGEWHTEYMRGRWRKYRVFTTEFKNFLD